MSFEQVICPNCRSTIAIPPGAAIASPIQCAHCGQYINISGEFRPPQYTLPQPISQQQLGPRKPPVKQPNPAPFGSASSLGQQGQLKDTPVYAELVSGEKSSKVGLVIGFSVAAGVLLSCAVMALVFLLMRAQPDEASNATNPDDPVTAQADGTPATDKSSASSPNLFETPVEFDRQPRYALTAPELRYLWKTGDKFAVDFEYDADMRGSHKILAGRVVYEVTDRDPSSVVKGDADSMQGTGTGTGFVVRPDGYLVTCAHVVQGATKIDVQLGKKVLPAKVVALDIGNDLAIVRVAASGLPHLTLRDSDDVRLAEEVRAFGFPLTDQLGEGIKITRGTVSGISRQEDKKVFQLDVTVNPGNSGGPLVNEQGHLVGVVTSLLAGEQIATMSFAVTSNDVRRLLDKSNLKYEVSVEDGEELSGPDLAERVQQSVALLKVTTGPDGVGIAKKRVLKFSGRWSPYSKTPGSSTRRISGSAVSESGSILIDEAGQVTHCDSDKAFPANLGLVALIGLQPLSEDGSKTWQSARLTVIAQRETKEVQSGPSYSPYDRLPPHLRPPRRPRSPFSRGMPNPYSRLYGEPRTESVSTVKLHPALEMTRFEVKDTTGDTVHIEKTLELATLHEEDEQPYLRVQGSGDLQFDKRAGTPKSFEFSAELTSSVDSASVKIPIRLSFKKVDLDVLAKDEEENQKRLQATKNAVAKARAEREALEQERNAIPLVRGLDRLDLTPRK